MSSGTTVQWSLAASARRAIAVCMGKAAGTGVRHLGNGSGGAIPGRVTLAIDPRALASLTAEIGHGSILVTGSNGKGTTCRMLAPVVRAAGLNPVVGSEPHQRSGLAATMIARAAATGHLRSDPQAIGLFEVHHESFAEIVRHVTEPTAIVCTNIFRGHRASDREPGQVRAQLERAIRWLPARTALILNADDPQVANLAPELPNPRLYFGLADPAYSRVHADRTADFPPCPRCNGELSYARVYYAHLGHWACHGCGLSRPQPQVRVTKIGPARSAATRLHVTAGTVQTVLEIPLPGLYNGYNAVAAIAAAAQCGLPDWSLAAVEQVTAGSGRMERISVTGHDVYLTVAENATGYTEVLRAVLGDGEPKRLLLGLGECAGQQPDTSWIWDVDFESLTGLAPAPVISGTKAADLAVRLKYAGWLGHGQDRGQSAGAIIEPDPVRAVQAAITATPAGQPLWIVSTSTALRDIRRWLRQEASARARSARAGSARAGSARAGSARAGSPRAGSPRAAGARRSWA
jgi:lipid II isoglutaminyl synthase (glutamine-hydrolysing)